jgi:hypothetical protein
MEPDCFVGRLYFISKVEKTIPTFNKSFDFELNSATKWSSEPVIRITKLEESIPEFLLS